MYFFQVRDAEAVSKRMKTDIHNCVGFLQEPKKLKESIKSVYEAYVHDDVVRIKLMTDQFQNTIVCSKQFYYFGFCVLKYRTVH